MMRWTFGILFVLLLGCKSSEPLTKDLEPVVIPAYAYYDMHQQRQLFKVHMTLAKQEFSGLLVIKEAAKFEYRSVFTTETGFKVFDFTVKNDGYTINYAVGALNKKFIAKRLAYTIQALVLRPLQHLPVQPAAGSKNLEFSAGKYSYDLAFNQAGNVVSQTVIYKGGKKAQATFFADNEKLSAADSGLVKHFGFPMEASFRQIKQ